MDEDELKTEMRLAVLEYFTAKMCATIYVALNTAPEAAYRTKLEAIAQARIQIFPGLDPAMSDLATAEWESAVTRFLDIQTTLEAQLRAARGP